MPAGKRYTPPASKAQMRFFGAAAGGQVPGFDPAEAQKKLKGIKASRLPTRKTKAGN